MRLLVVAAVVHTACFVAPDRPRDAGDGMLSCLTGDPVLPIAIAVPDGSGQLLVRAGMDGSDVVVMGFGGPRFSSRCPTSKVVLPAGLSAVHALAYAESTVFVLGTNMTTNKLEVRLVGVQDGMLVGQPGTLRSLIELLSVPIEQDGAGGTEHPAFIELVDNPSTSSKVLVFGGGNSVAYGAPPQPLQASTAATVTFTTPFDQVSWYQVAPIASAAGRSFVLMSPSNVYVTGLSGSMASVTETVGGSCADPTPSACRGRVTHAAHDLATTLAGGIPIVAYGITRTAPVPPPASPPASGAYFEAIGDRGSGDPLLAAANLDTEGRRVLDVALDELVDLGKPSARDVIVLYEGAHLAFYLDVVDPTSPTGMVRTPSRSKQLATPNVDQLLIVRFGGAPAKILALSSHPAIDDEICLDATTMEACR